ncbi:Zinc knuckle CX2CX4HX4C [Arabidopsis suecica]|nr:Zinc knuckle CX2CX4HX4C [Arabidopsis suecica]
MIGFEYEKLRRICTNCCRITHHVNNCPFLNAPVIHDDEVEVLDVPVWEEGAASNTITDQTHMTSSDSSDISSASLISQPLPPASLASHEPHLVAGSEASRLVNPRPIPQNHFSSSSSDFKGKGKAKMEIGECSKRKKDKQVVDDALRNVRQCRKDQGIRIMILQINLDIELASFVRTAGAVASHKMMKLLTPFSTVVLRRSKYSILDDLEGYITSGVYTYKVTISTKLKICFSLYFHLF